jgi:hypothetical protein
MQNTHKFPRIQSASVARVHNERTNKITYEVRLVTGANKRRSLQPATTHGELARNYHPDDIPRLSALLNEARSLNKQQRKVVQLA